MRKPLYLAGLALLVLAACSGSGPDTNAIMNAQNAQKISDTSEAPFVLVDTGRAFARRLSDTYPDFTSRMPQSAAQLS